MGNITEAFISGLFKQSQIIPNDAINQARKVLLDYLGVLVGGKKFLEEKHPELHASSPSSVFLNGFASHVLELDDGHRFGMIHLGASIVSAVLGVAQRLGLSSYELLRGIVMGYEVAVRCARSIQPGHKERGYHVSGTCGTIGAAAGIGFACGYSEEQMKSTLACAVSSAAGLLEIQEQASEMKPFNVGHAAMSGLVSAQVGKLAMNGPDDIFGGKHGFFAALTNSPHPEILTDFSEGEYAIEGIYQKVHAACRHCHPAIDATLSIRNEKSLIIDLVDRIEVRTYHLAVGSHDHTQIKGISSAKLSTPFSIALAIVRGSAGYADYSEKNLDDVCINQLIRKVGVYEDDDLTRLSPAVRGAKVAIYLKDGCVFEAQCLYPKGEPENPLSQQELEDKFRNLAVYGGLTSNECDEVIGEIMKNEFDIKKIASIIGI